KPWRFSGGMYESRPRPLRCHLPIIAVSYPAADITFASVTAPSARCASLRNTPWVIGRCPVRSEARHGLQTGYPETALMKLTLAASRRSRLGVLTFGSPAYSVAAARHW